MITVIASWPKQVVLIINILSFKDKTPVFDSS